MIMMSLQLLYKEEILAKKGLC